MIAEMKFWRLTDGGQVERCSMQDWAQAFGNKPRIVAQARASVNGAEVFLSSVFIGHGDLPFETMLFIDGDSRAATRAETAAEAMAQFDAAITELEAQFSIRIDQQKLLSPT